jgi:hypothetical protein
LFSLPLPDKFSSRSISQWWFRAPLWRVPRNPLRSYGADFVGDTQQSVFI